MKHITKDQRYQIEAYLKSGKSNIFISRELHISESSLSREIIRNAQKRGGYNASHAQMLTDERKERFSRNRKFDSEVQKTIELYILHEQWSPEQIVGHCRKENIKMVSHERIYQYIRKDKGENGKLYKQLRHRLKHRKRPVGGKKIVIKNKVSIDKRAEVINNRERFGDWEIDTIVGNQNKGAIVTIVERQTGFLMMKKLPHGKHADQLAHMVIEMLLPYKNQVHSITADNGTEFACHEKIAKKLNSDFYFAHPYSSWERGLNEYTNKLIRQYIPKKSNFNDFNEMDINSIQHKLNRRPRKKLHFEFPTQVFYKLVS